MHISLGSRVTRLNQASGYGYATDRMLWALRELGHTVTMNDPAAPVEIWFDQPDQWTWRPHQYKIGYHPWESTNMRRGWVDSMNACDEIWTPSPLVAEWYRQDGVQVPVYTYEHGVDKVWTEKSRHVDGPFRFLHIGGEAVRKGLPETVDAFRKAFPNNPDVQLTLKMIAPGWNIPLHGKVRLENSRMSLDELVQMYHDHHVYVYPSWGEGFGLTPLQAMATGMPTITVPAWAPYASDLDPRLEIGSKLVYSPWPSVHPGKMFQPSVDDTVDRMRWVVDNWSSAQKFAQARVPILRERYDWLALTESMFNDLQKRL